MGSISVTNNSGKTVVFKSESDETVSESDRNKEFLMNDGESIVIFTERAKCFSVEIA